MNFLKIKSESGYYNFYSNDNTYYVTHTNTKRTRTLDEEEVNALLTYVFSSDMTYSHDENNYQIYIDEMNNKRYFRNGKEDLIKFIFNNGTSAIYASSNKKEMAYEDVGKMITLKVKKDIITMLLVVSETAAMFTGSLAFNNELMRSDPYLQVGSSELMDLIEKTSDIPEEQKNYFKNDTFIRDMIRLASYSRSEELRQRLKNFGIVYFDDDELNNPQYDNITGYYEFLLTSNKIHLRDEEYFDWAAAHEFVHLFQCNTQYNYIIEPCAEMMSHEYFERDQRYTYAEDVRNLSLLMEVIGPKPILECCFADIDTSLENAIGEYLDENDKNELLKELRVKTKNADKAKIRLYIKKMIKRKRELHPELEYLNKNLDGWERMVRRNYFFNQHSPKFYRKCHTEKQACEVLKPVDLDNIEQLTYSIKEKTTLDKIKELYETGEINNYYTISVGYNKGNGIYYDYAYTEENIDDQSIFDYHPKDFEAFYKAYIENQEDDIAGFELINRRTLTDKDEINDELRSFGHDNHSSYRLVDYNHNYRSIIKEDGKLIEPSYEMRFYPMPSISELFPEQCFVDKSEVNFTNNDLDKVFIEGTIIETGTRTDENGNTITYKTILHEDGRITTETEVKSKSKSK